MVSPYLLPFPCIPCVYLEDAFASGAVGACVVVGVEVLHVLIVTPGPELGLGQGACLSLLIFAGRGHSAPRSAASAWRSLCRRAALPAVLSRRTDLLILSPNLV